MAKEELLDAVIKNYREKLRVNPGSLVFVQLADALRKRGKMDEALGVCQDGMTHNPNLLSGMIMMGRIHVAQKKPAEGIAILRQVVERESNNMTAHALLSQAYMAQGNFNEAIAEYQKILALNPEDNAAQQALQVALDRMRKEGSKPVQDPSAPPPGDGALSLSDSGPAGHAAAAPAGAGGAQVEPAAQAMEVPAYAAAEELMERGLFDEAIEAFQRILEADPDNLMARQKLREAYAMSEATETPASIAEAPSSSAAPVQSKADKITDDEILFLLGLMEAGTVPDAGAAPSGSGPADSVTPGPNPAKELSQPAFSAAPTAAVSGRAPVAPTADLGSAADSSPLLDPAPPRPASAPAPAAPSSPVTSSLDEERVGEALKRLSSTGGMRQAFLVNGEQVISAGKEIGAEQREKVLTLVRMLSDVTRRAAIQMKQGEVKQVLVFGTEGIVMVGPSSAGTLGAVAGAAVNVGLMRIALNDCLKRLADVS